MTCCTEQLEKLEGPSLRGSTSSRPRAKKDGEFALRLLLQSSSDNAGLEWTVLAVYEALFEVSE
jgi:hypothetical protein